MFCHWRNNISLSIFCFLSSSASGLQITKISEDLYDTLTPKPTINPIADFDLRVEGAGGQSIPHIGCIECSIGVPFLDYKEMAIPALVVTTTQYGLKVPVLVGTNSIRECKVFCNESSQVRNEWNFFFIPMQESSLRVVKQI